MQHLRTISYRPDGTPSLTIRGKFLIERYGLARDDKFVVSYLDDEIRISIIRTAEVVAGQLALPV